MIKNNLKIAFRNLWKHKSFTFINIVGLAIGFAACIIIFLYVHYDLTYDQYNTKTDRIARVTTTIFAPESEIRLATSPTPLAKALVQEYPEVESAVRLEESSQVIKFNNKLSREDDFYKTDQSIFSIFDFDFIEGSATGALLDPNSIVIDQTIAKKYFGNEQALGKTMVCGDEVLRVTAVVKDRPANSDIQIRALLSSDFSGEPSWMDDFSLFTYILFKNTPKLKNFENKLEALSVKYVQPELDAQGAVDYKVQFELEPLADVHFSQGKVQDTPKGNKQFGYIFSLLAVFILVIALLNYINLSTAKSTERAKEVGVRKVSGASQFQLIRQFLFESFLLVAIAWSLALVLVQIALSHVNELLQTKLTFDLGQNLILIVGVFLATFLLAGIYPAFVLSGFNPVSVLKGSGQTRMKGVFLRKSVTVIQFAIAAALIMGTTVIYTQMDFIKHKDLGFNKEQLLNVQLPQDSVSQQKIGSFQNELIQRTQIQGVTVGNGLELNAVATTFAEKNGKKSEFLCNYFLIDPQFLPVFEIHLKEGRNLSENIVTDKNKGFLVNEAFIKRMGWKSGEGKSIEGNGRKGQIVGVIKDFYYKSLHNMIEPLVLIYNDLPDNGMATITTIKIKPSDLPVVNSIFMGNFPEAIFDYSFLDETVNNQYRQDEITMSMFKIFTLLAILISCLGLYGLVSLISVQRTKEIGIRKVLGASLKQLLSLLSQDFLKLALCALIIALPVAGIAMNKWLANYAYHAQLSWWMFLIPIVCILIITLIIISKEVIKAAIANPAKSLRSE